MIGWMFLLVWLIATEFIYFAFIRDDLKDFFGEKLASVMSGLLFTIILVGLPWIFSIVPTDNGEVAFGNSAFFWYYGFITFVSIFGLVNYKISEKLDLKEKEEKKRIAREKRKKKKRKAKK